MPIGKLYRENAFGTRAALLPEHAFPKPVPDCFSRNYLSDIEKWECSEWFERPLPKPRSDQLSG